MKKIIISILALLIIMPVFSQKVDLEKTHEITGKAKRGKLYTVTQNPDNGNYRLVYITKATDYKIRLEFYFFDKDFNFLKTEEKKYKIDDLKEEFPSFNYEGEEITQYSMRVSYNPMFPLKLKKKETVYQYNWDEFAYYEVSSTKTKVKPKTEEGFAYLPKPCLGCDNNYGMPSGAYFTDESKGDVYVLAGARGGKLMSKDLDINQEYLDFHLLKYDINLEKKADVQIKFEYPQDIIMGRSIPTQKGMAACFVFAPSKLQKKFKLDPNNKNFTFVYIDDNLEVNRIKFEPPTAAWRIDEIITVNNNGKTEFYLYGPADEDKGKYWAKAWSSGKYSMVRAMKVADNKVEYLNDINIEEFEKKMKLPPSQKKGEEYKGKKVVTANYKVFENGDLFVMGQHIAKNEGPIYGNITGFHFDAKGNLKAHYSVEQHENPKHSWLVNQSVIEKASDAYWVLLESDEPNKIFPAIGKINIDKGEVSDFLRLGTDEKGKKQEYYLNTTFPMLQISSNQIVYFGEDKRGKNIWFCRVNLE